MATFPGINDSSDENKKGKFRQYNPYKDLGIYGNSPIQTLYNLPESPEFLFHEESLHQRRTWSDNLQFYTGTAYLAGASVGGISGAYSGIRAAEIGESLKLRINRVLNSGGHTGRTYGNRLGCMGLIFSGIESLTMYSRGGNDDAVNSILAGLGTGALYRAASGPRSAAVAGAVGGLTAGVAILGKNLIKRYVPI